MGVGLFGLLWLIIWGVRSLIARHLQKVHNATYVAGAPTLLPQAVATRGPRLTLSTRVHLLFPHRAGSRPSPKRLMSARRYAEASKAISPDDHDRRIALAVRRRGPVPDLLLGARGRWGSRRDLSRAILSTLYEGENWGFEAQYALGTGDSARSAYTVLPSRMGNLKLGKAARLARATRRAFPQADTRYQTLLDLACVEALRGRADAARAITVDLANSDAPPYVRDQASRMSQRIGAASRRGDALEPTRAKSATAATLKLRKAAHTKAVPWPDAPHDILAILGDTAQITDRTLDARAIATNLAQRHDVWVSVLTPHRGAEVLPVVAVEPAAKVVLLGDGVAMDIDALGRASVWGDRMVVVHPVGVEPAGKPQPTPFTQMPCPRDESGRVDHSPQALLTLRRASRDFPDDALAGYHYALALHAAYHAGGHEGYDYNEHRRHLATTAARFPDHAWPLVFLAERLEHDGDSRPGALMTVGLARTLLPGDHAAGAQALFDVEHADALLRDHLVTYPTQFQPLVASAHRAAARRDGKDFDVHLDLLQRVDSYNDQLPHLRQVREVVWRGPVGALSTVQGDSSDPHGAYVRLRLAAHTGSATLLQTHAGHAALAGHHRDPRDAQVLLAMHTGDYDAVLAAAHDAAATDGLSQVISTALTDATETLAAPGDTRLIETLEYSIANGDREVFNLTGLLLTRRSGTAVDILRAKVSHPGDSVEINGRLTRALVHHASHLPPATREPLAREALEAMSRIEAAKPTIPVWDILEVAAWRSIDPDRAFDVLTKMEHLAKPLTSLLLAAAVATDRGDHDLAQRMISRAANPEFLRAGLGWAAHMGIDRELNLAFAHTDPALVRDEAWAWLGLGGELPSLPPAPRFGESSVSEDAMWALVARGEFDLARTAHLQRWSPQTLLDFADGAPRAAIVAAIKALTKQPAELRDALTTSKHPAYLRAAALCAAAGVDVQLPPGLLQTAAPGLAQGVRA